MYVSITGATSTYRTETELATTATMATASSAETAAAKAVTVLIIGKTGNGKSSVANTLLGRDVFQTGSGMMPTTTTAQQATRSLQGITVKASKLCT